MSRNRNRNAIQNTFKDYLVPIVGWVILLILIFSIFWGDDSENIQTNSSSENIDPVNVNFISEDTQAFIMYPWDEREEIQAWASLYKWESVIVREGIVELNFWNNNTVSLNRVAELKYNENGSLSLFSSDAWISLAENTDISMRYANIESPAWSVLSLTQNEASSTIYVLDGSAKVTNLWWVSTSIVSGQKLSISRQFAADEQADLTSDKWSIDSYFKSSDWFIENDGITALNQASDTENQDETGTDSGTGSLSWETGIFLRFNGIRDEWNIETSSLDMSWSILIDTVELITINGKQAEISEDNTFSVAGINTNQSVNDVVVKIYDENRAILDKKVITLYNSNPSAQTSNQGIVPSNTQNTSVTTNSQWVTTFWVDATEFAFTFPSASWQFTTTSPEVTIRGITTAENITKVEVNGFELASFNGSTWRYHAFERFETLESWTNQYKVDYYGSDNSIVYTDYYTIVKRDSQPAASTVDTSADTSWDTNQEEDLEESNTQSEIPPEEDLFQ